jgi:gas vesicle protein
MEKTNDIGRVLGALLLGAAVGGTLGILFAPDKGSETRKKISAKGSDLSDGMREKFNALLDELKADISMVKSKANELTMLDGVAHGNSSS